MLSSFVAILAVSRVALGFPGPNAPYLSPQTLSLVLQRLAEGATHSWEIGTRETALLELQAPNAFLYQGSTIPPVIHYSDDVSDTFASVDSVIAQKPAGILPFFSDGATGDPCSVGIPVLIYNWTQHQSSSVYATDATEQLTYLLTEVPRNAQGALSQRTSAELFQAWADFTAMAPPFIAYYGAITNNRTLVEFAYQQISDYRDILIDSSGLLEHILGGGSNSAPPDTGHWSTGNGWFLDGLVRVLTIIELSPFSSSMTFEKNNLIQWGAQLINEIWTHQQPEGYLWNYIDLPPPNSNNQSFPEASGTTLIAASTFRMSTYLRRHQIWGAPWINVAAAEKARAWSISQVNQTTGWLESVVNPENWRQAGSNSPEGQSFVVMLYSAYRDWDNGFYY